MKQIDRTKAINEQHIRISRSMLYSNAFQNLTAVEIKLYMAMRMKFHKEEEKNEEFAFAKSLGVKILKLSSNSEKTIRRGLQGLVKKGFIEQTYISKGRR